MNNLNVILNGWLNFEGVEMAQMLPKEFYEHTAKENIIGMLKVYPVLFKKFIKWIKHLWFWYYPFTKGNRMYRAIYKAIFENDSD